ncbi:DegV family protein [Mycoplasma yeatsii]|uniref:DegV family protein n=1 Tax=Mycoplasma yeatsii TaxID=51365 RepID=UPI0005B2464A|nr:DegV family protein [Mycoplasma yeatsii]AJM72098.1 putative fatty acid kinase subunit FakB-2 [Mycoplasma yeatsii GM274B]
MKIGILIDSSSIYDVSKLKDTNIDLLPLHIVMPDNSEILDSESGVTKNNILKRVDDGENIKTSQASPGELEQKYSEMLKEYDHIIHIPITKNLSSMLQTALLVSNDEKFVDKVTVYENTDLAAQGISLIALELSKAIQNNEIKTPTEAIKFIDKNKSRVYVSIIPGDLKRLLSGGRALGILTSVLNILKTKLLMVWGKEPKKEAFGRTYSSLTERVIKNLKDKYNDSEFELFVLKTPLTNEKTFSIVKKTLDEAKVKFSDDVVPNIYTVHAGIDTIAFIAIKK